MIEINSNTNSNKNILEGSNDNLENAYELTNNLNAKFRVSSSSPMMCTSFSSLENNKVLVKNEAGDSIKHIEQTKNETQVN